uniref:Uncharacterized protein n=1 Tax=Rhizophagus irregularis (strain DAOM 181602 / DAOM 197198 / MUCL 43194) TaxID=747089 RepID=U9TAT6_RHIID
MQFLQLFHSHHLKPYNRVQKLLEDLERWLSNRDKGFKFKSKKNEWLHHLISGCPRNGYGYCKYSIHIIKITKKIRRLPFNDKAADAMSYIADKELKRMESYTIATAHYV